MDEENITPERSFEELRKEILQAINSKSELEDMTWHDHSFSLFQDPLDDTVYKPKTYFEELCRWMSAGYGRRSSEIYTEKDYVVRYDEFPPEQEPFADPDNILREVKLPLSEEDLEVGEVPARETLFDRSIEHRVFLISMLEAVMSNTFKLVEKYAAVTNRKEVWKNGEGMEQCLEALIANLEYYLEEENRQLIPLLYSLRGDGVFMSVEMEENEDENPVYEFGFSKETSDAFTRKLITVLRQKLLDKGQVQHTNSSTYEEGFSLIEKALILSYLQDTDDFIISSEQKRINELSALLFDSHRDSMKKAFQKAHHIRIGQLTSSEAKARVRNLQRILPVFQRLGLAETVKRIESRIKKVQEFIK